MRSILIGLILAAAPAAKDAPPTGGSSKPTPETGLFYGCGISSGQPTRCGEIYQGRSVVQTSARVRECTIVNGSLTECGNPYDGEAALMYDGSYRECNIAAGEVTDCRRRIEEGSAVVWRGQGLPAIPKQAKEGRDAKQKASCKDGGCKGDPPSDSGKKKTAKRAPPKATEKPTRVRSAVLSEGGSK